MSIEDARRLSAKALQHGLTTPEHAAAKFGLPPPGYVPIAPDPVPIVEQTTTTTKEEESKPMATGDGGINLPNMAGIGGALDKLKFGLEARAKKFMERIEAIDTRSDAVFDRANQHVSGADRQLDQVNEYLDQVDKATSGNGGPLDVAPTT